MHTCLHVIQDNNLIIAIKYIYIILVNNLVSQKSFLNYYVIQINN